MKATGIHAADNTDNAVGLADSKMLKVVEERADSANLISTMS